MKNRKDQLTKSIMSIAIGLLFLWAIHGEIDGNSMNLSSENMYIKLFLELLWIIPLCGGIYGLTNLISSNPREDQQKKNK